MSTASSGDTFLANRLYAYRIWIVSKGRSRALPATVGIIVILSSGEFIS
ncbi:hypothetical protein AZE42_05627 [Rhizopogon vesiculosus]|uniref:Uncharacterized protein n=1 Tax=Rhizopogon vesiculosus TaxID=180088 RepID=A0A1J8R2C9_9AGAM|nr:hypothetical protein AZE42_05627 [Rhizopogon vesiculosus]